jgi:crotonobetainyl-CoA:carnitine CoA-transferase CaiB-like acyl-CoA transferase
VTSAQELPPVATDSATLKVLDIGTLVGGPFSATLLADLGAEVIKVEPPGKGDFIRGISPYGSPGNSLHWQVHGRGKRSISLNLRVPAGQEIFRELAAWADLLIENMRPGTMERWGLGYQELATINPRLVYLSVSGFGQTGPYRDRPSYEFAASAFGGLTYLTGFPDRPPVLPGIAIMDHTSGMFGLIGALEAVRRRDAMGEQGRGCYLDMALYEPAMRMSNEVMAHYVAHGVSFEREGSIPSGSTAPHNHFGSVYETRDGHFVACYPSSYAQFEQMAKMMDRDDMLTDPRFATDEQRKYSGFPAVDAILRAWVLEHDFDEVCQAMEKAKLAYGPVFGPAEFAANEHVIARENLVTLDDGLGGKTTVPAPVPMVNGERPKIRWAAQPLGASNHSVYQGLLGKSADELRQLTEQGVI